VRGKKEEGPQEGSLFKRRKGGDTIGRIHVYMLQMKKKVHVRKKRAFWKKAGWKISFLDTIWINHRRGDR